MTLFSSVSLGVLSIPGGLGVRVGTRIYQLAPLCVSSRNICNQHSKCENLTYLNLFNPPTALRGVCDYSPLLQIWQIASVTVCKMPPTSTPPPPHPLWLKVLSEPW